MPLHLEMRHSSGGVRPSGVRPNQRLMGSCSEPVPFQAIR